jgi:uncharacterized membrane protein YfcA
MSIPLSEARSRSRFALLAAIPIAMLGGLIGLGGAEFRLPVLIGPLRYGAKQAVPLNLSVSLVTILASLVMRGRSLVLESLEPLLPVIASMIGGAMVAAFVGATLASRIEKDGLERIIVILLVIIGLGLFVEGFLPQQVPALLSDRAVVRVVAGVIFGLAIGLVSSLLGVAGGELIIPTLIFAYGIDIRLAGTASLMISLPTVVVGILRYRNRGAFDDRRPLRETVLPMGIGSILGALLGALLVGIVSASILKIGLGVVLMVSAVRMGRAGHG